MSTTISACAREPRAWARGRRPFTFATFWVLETHRTCGSRQRPLPQAPANRAHGRNPTTKRVGGHARVAKPKRVHVQIAPPNRWTPDRTTRALPRSRCTGAESGSTITITITVVIHFDEDDTNVTAWWIPKSTVHLCVPRIGFRNPRRRRGLQLGCNSLSI